MQFARMFGHAPCFMIGALTCLIRIAAHSSPPPNDFWQASTRLGGLSGSTNGSTIGATAELFEPPVNTGGHSIWYLWVPPVSGIASATAESDFTILLSVFAEGDPVRISTLALRTTAESTIGSPASITWPVEPGHPYWIAIDGKDGAMGNVVLNWNLASDGRQPDLVPSVGDAHILHFTGPINPCEIGHGCGDTNTRRVLRFGTLTQNIGEADLYLGGIDGLAFEYHPCHAHSHLLGYADYRLLSNGTPAVLGAKASFCLRDGVRHDTNAPARGRYDCNFQGISRGWGDYYWSTLPCQWIDITDVPAGRYTLQVEIDAVNQLPESNDDNNLTQLEVFVPPEPASHVNETLETATDLQGPYQERLSSNRAASRDAGEPIIGAGETVWYRWTAPSNGVVSFDVIESYFPATLGVFSGDSLSNLVAVPNIDPFPIDDPAQRIIFHAIAGTAYYIIVDSVLPGTSGPSFRLNWWFDPPPNDHFEHAQGWFSATYNVRLSSVNATKQPGEPDHAGNPGGRSVWIPWTPRLSRQYTLNTEASTFNTLLAVYTGTALSNLVEIASNDDLQSNRWSQVTIDAVADTQYWIAIDGRDGEAGRISLSIREQSPPLQFLSVRLRLGEIEFEVTGPSDRSYQIHASANLLHWTAVASVYKEGGPFTFSIPLEPAKNHLFFRAHLLPEND